MLVRGIGHPISADKSANQGQRDDGFSLMELMVVTAILMVVMTAILSMLEVATRQERRTTAVVDNQNNVMLAFNKIGRELRGANPIDVSAVGNTEELENSVTVWVGSESDGNRRQWRFRVDPATSELVQECLSGCAGGATTREVLVPRIVNTATEPLFQYFKGYGDDPNIDQLKTAAGDPDQVVKEDVAHCTVRIVIRIRSAAEANAPVYDATTDTEVRNTLPGGRGC